MREIDAAVSSQRARNEDQEPLVSVVVIFFDEEHYLQEAVESVLGQTWKAWELLLVDDGSSDRSTDYAKEIAQRIPNSVCYLEHEGHANRGMSTSRNLGLAHAKGEFILFLDADDVLAPNTLSEQVALMRAHPEAATVYGPMQWWYSGNRDPNERRDFIQHIDVKPDSTIDGSVLVAKFLRNEEVTPSGNLFRTSLVRQVGGFEDDFRGMYEDQVLRVKICLRFPSYASSRVWYRYRRHKDSSCYQAVRMNQAYAARARFLNWTEDYCRQHHIRDRRVWKALRQALREYRYPRFARFKKQMAFHKKRLAFQMMEMLKPVARLLLPKTIRSRIWAYYNSRMENQRSLL